VEWECRKYGRIGKLPRNGCMSEWREANSLLRGPKMLDATVQNLVAMANWPLALLHTLCTKLIY
jgi:hypothetical protein